MAINIVLVSVALMVMLFVYARDSANLDSLTEIPNRRRFFAVLDEAFVHASDRGRGRGVAIGVMGAGVSLDDFGAGYSSPSHVRNLPLDKIKIDRSFIVDITADKVSHDIVKSLQALVRGYWRRLRRRGVEEAAQVAALDSVGCSFAQGLYFSHPIPDSEVRAYLDRSVSAAAASAA